jgi:antitoxin (DNA-binding transcriptional repressor) of toxin-antitoxin stability system
MQPSMDEFEWAPIPIFIEDIPADIPTPNTGTTIKEEVVEETIEETDGPDEGKNKNEPEDGNPPATDSVPPSAELVPEMAEVQTVEIPLVGVEIPLPRTEILVTAATTAGVSSVVAVGGTLIATTLFRELIPLLKPIFKTILKKVAKIRKTKPPESFGRLRLKARYQRTEGKKVKKG